MGGKESKIIEEVQIELKVVDYIKKYSILSDPKSSFNQIMKKYMQNYIILKNKSKYYGESLKNIPNGMGREFKINGDIYQGLFINGKKTGFGEFYDKKNNFFYVGNFLDDLFESKGCIFKDDICFEGEFVKNKSIKKGIYIRNNEIIKNDVWKC